MSEYSDKILNLRHIISNIDEAMEQLQKIKKACKTGDYDPGEFLVEMQHALYHLNFAFNSRFYSDEELESLSQEEWEKLKQSPIIF